MLLNQSFSQLVLGTACLMSFAAHADANLLTNPSFELGAFVNDGNATMVLPVGSTTISGWTVVADQMAWIDTGNPWGLSAHDGDRFLDLTAYPGGAPFGGVSQNIGTVAGQMYELSFHLGTYTQRWGGPPVSILASAGDSNQTFTVSDISTESTWTAFSMFFTATSADTLVALTGTAGLQYIGLDNVSVEQIGGGTVPEPGTYGLFAVGFALLAAARHRRAKR